MVETLARMTKSDLRDVTPPTDEEMEAWFGLEREAVTGRLYQRALDRVGLAAASEGSVQMSGGAPTPGEEASGRVCAAGEMGGCDAAARRPVQMSGEDPSERGGVSDEVGGCDATSVPPVQMSEGEDAAVIEADAANGASEAQRASRHRGTVTRYWPVRESTLLFWRELEEAHRASGMESSFLSFLCCAFWAAWGPALTEPQDSVWQHIYDRDRRRCTCPVCPRRKRLEDHHLLFRSRGGGDDAENNAAACDFCHRPGVHEGRLKVLPPASRMRWRIGRRPLLEVVGREKREVA